MPTCPQGTRPNRRLLGAYMLLMYAAYSLPSQRLLPIAQNSNDLHHQKPTSLPRTPDTAVWRTQAADAYLAYSEKRD